MNKHTFTLVTLAMLESGRNIRKVSADSPDFDSLVQSIKNHGLLENLIVQPIENKKDKYRVIAGHRRLSALRVLEREKEINKAYEIPCLIVNSEINTKEIALAENTIRAAMHPADQVVVFRTLVNDKRNTAVEIADRFGLSERTVHQRLRMANVHNDILDAYRNNEIPQDAVIAFTLSSNKNEQKALFESMKKAGREIDGYYVRSTVTNTKINADNKCVRYIGLDKYIEAGGETTLDLFANTDDPAGVWINNLDLVNELALEKLSKFAEKQDTRWAWTEAILDHDYESVSKYKQVLPEVRAATDEEAKIIRSHAESWNRFISGPEAEKDQLEKEYDTLSEQVAEIREKRNKTRSFRPEHYANAGCIVSIDYRGKATVSTGLVKKEDWKTLTKQIKQADHTGNGNDNGTNGADTTQTLTYTKSLTDDLAYLRTTIIKTHLAKHPELALDLLTYQLAHSLQINTHYYRQPLSINASETENQPVAPAGNDMHERNNPGMALFETMIASLDLRFITEKDAEKSYRMFQSLEKENKMQILAAVIANTLNRQLSAEHGDRNPMAATEISVSQMDITWYQLMPLTADFFFNRIPKQALFDIGDELFSADLWSIPHAGLRKKELAEMLARHCNPDHVSPELNAEQKEKAETWTPLGFKAVPAH